MSRSLIISEKTHDSLLMEADDISFCSAADFISGDVKKPFISGRPKIVNLCSHYDYLSKGYYVSLLAEARGLRCVPSVSDILRLNWKRNYRGHLEELNQLLQKSANLPVEEPLSRTYTIYFGRTPVTQLEDLARRIFDLFRFPVLSLNIKANTKGAWEIKSLDPLPVGDLPPQNYEPFKEALQKYTGAAWRSKNKKIEKHWIAILHNPQEAYPPSNKAALQKFIKIGKDMGLFVELVTKADEDALLEYDALFIRETTAINHHTYRFARKAEDEDIPCIDDTQSIIRCCNKVFQHELLMKSKIPAPLTQAIDRRALKTPPDLGYPAVIKIPDGSFSRGVIKVNNEEEFKKGAETLLKNSEIILIQEFLESEYDWRVGILNGRILFASQYFMAQNHWQIYNHDSKTRKNVEGDFKAVDPADVPEEVSKLALKAADLIGKGLYGVDIKMTSRGPVVIEINDNPNIDHGIEDKLAGDTLFREILQHFCQLIES